MTAVLHAALSFLKKILVNTGIYLPVILLALATVFPFFYMFIASSKNYHEILYQADKLLFARDWVDNVKDNYKILTQWTPFWGSVINSIYISVMSTFFALLGASLGGYAFAVYRFKGKELLYGIMLVTLMIPPTVGVIPLFSMMKAFGWFSQARALYLPCLASAYGVFMVRKYLESSMPGDLIDAARIDGCSEFKIYYHVILPLALPILGALGIITFITSWGAFFLPMLLLQEPSSWTVPLLMSQVPPSSALLAGTLTTIPFSIVFLILSRWIISGVTEGAFSEI